jgi:hypothetical protein
VTDEFLRTLPEDLFDYLLAAALSFFRRGRQMDIDALLTTEFYAIAVRLWSDEQGEHDYEPTDEEVRSLVDRLARLVLLEEQRRVGAFAWINPYSLLSRVTDDFPPRLPVVDRGTCH